jgi:rfaE bifunctional protein kinase chain/domain/rfaE bifunctional protein nucleotidyltransferase chain/domain
MKELSENYSHKIKSAEVISEIVGSRPRENIVIMCHGTFDVVHPGHIRHLLYAKSKGDVLVASLTCDRHVMKDHGGTRPYVPEELRAINLAAFEMVDYVTIDPEPTPLINIAKIQPDYFAKGYEYTAEGQTTLTKDETKVVQAYGGEMIFTPGDIVYSSTSILELSSPKIGIERLVTLMEAENITFSDLRKSLDTVKNLHVHVVGDTIVDSYSYCTMIGGMTKTPTFSVRFDRRQDFVGGAGVVSKHLKAAGANVTFSTVLGDDDLRDYVLEDLEEAGIRCNPIIDETRPTTNKNAFIAGGYRLLKVDTLDNQAISQSILDQLSSVIKKINSDIVVFSDFRHGVFNTQSIPILTDSIPKKTFRVADSQVASRWGNILEFQGFDLITPNEREARFSLADQDSGVRFLALNLFNAANCKTVILKLGDRGIITYRTGEAENYRAFFTIDSFADNVVDAVGAGDALLAYATLTKLGSGNDLVASILGSFAAGIECEQDGNVPVFLEDINNKIDAVESQANFG